MSLRPVKDVRQSVATMEGAGVALRRAFGFGNTSDFDPFLLFDDFRNDNPDAYLAGFPWHPHRGIETITYVLAGTVEHGDSLGNRGRMGPGDVQWMTAGSGILHQEMPKGDGQGLMHGFQLWSNLPSSLKMTKPRYQDISAADIPEVTDDDGTRVRVVIGDFWGRRVPLKAWRQTRAISTSRFRRAGKSGWRSIGRTTRSRMCSRGRVHSRDASDPQAVATEQIGGARDGEFDLVGNRSLVLFDRGDEIVVQAGDEGIRFLLVSGKPLEEPVAWRGPIVMNTNLELQQAYAELRAGTFIK